VPPLPLPPLMSHQGNMTVLTSDPAELHARLAGSLAAFTDCELLPAPLNASAVSANGYCFGGQMVLELARQGAAVAAVTSFHGEVRARACVWCVRVWVRACRASCSSASDASARGRSSILSLAVSPLWPSMRASSTR